MTQTKKTNEPEVLQEEYFDGGNTRKSKALKDLEKAMKEEKVD